MKKSILFIVAAILMTANTFAQQGHYQAVMGKNLEALRTAQTLEDYQLVANGFERMAAAEQQQWLPTYYASFSYINMSFREKDDDKRDQYLDKAQQHLDKALKLQPKESELYALQGFLHMARIQVSPMMRGMKYSGLAKEALEKAKNLNPDNPRVYYLLGSNTFHTPSMFGGGSQAAKPLLEQAKLKFEKQRAATALAPSWGEPQTLALLAKCN